MAFSSFPFDNQDTTEAQYSTLFRELQDTGIVGSYGGSDLKVTSDGSGMHVTVAPGSAIVRGHYFTNDANYSMPIAAAHPTLDRVDLVVVRLDPANNEIVPALVQGTPGAGVPAVSQTDADEYEFPIGQVNVAASVTSIVAAAVVDVRSFVGTRIGIWSTATRPRTPRAHQLGYNTTLGLWEHWQVSQWVALIPNPVANSTLWNGYSITVSQSTPSGDPTPDRIWIQPTS